MLKIRSGFSILEMIMVVAIVAVLATWFLVNAKPTKRLGEAADAQRQYDVEAIEKAIKLVASDTGELNSALTSLTNNQPYAIVQAGASTAGTYTCTATGTAINKVDISGAIASVMPSLPVDPDLADNSNDTGYYIVRNNNSYNIETCDSYYLAATIGNKQMCGDGYCGNTESCSSCSADCGNCGAVCGNGAIEGAEVCDDGNTVTETQTCANNIVESGNHCSANCQASIVLTENCEFLSQGYHCYSPPAEIGPCADANVYCEGYEPSSTRYCNNCVSGKNPLSCFD